MIRFLLKTQSIRNKTVVFDQEQSKKIRKVLRMRPGDKVEVFDNKGWKYSVELEKITNDFTVGKIVEQEMISKSSEVVLYQALPKSLKVEFIIQKCTELGVDKIVFFESDFSQVKANLISKTKVDRWKKIASDATEQCGRSFVPEVILETRTIKEFTDEVDANNSVVLYKEGYFIKSDEFKGIDLLNINFFVGSEGGFSPDEMKHFATNKFKQVKISNNILRSETAGMAFLSQLALMHD